MRGPLYHGTTTYLQSLLVLNANVSQFIYLFSEVSSQCVLLLEYIGVSGMDLSIVALLNNSYRRDLPSSITMFLSGLLEIRLAVSRHLNMTPMPSAS
ncbi:hypothetical protein BDV38DRAFT_41830 [Aspergillus pseudotamarii]|uniref:STAS domain-containing protein n=1 Tax=Aspergillus pseudotamarii TaxID=132259 RepID=A0A5N6SYY3_ASPPS|nr:uncharacterized protein BDV38DRAFT_41830 [Aspergillus pseudotamarii]KAE8139898.1 hypothetical protein BDV38DRAFT_41830 [Aspergillus pseudotamarii]